MKNVLQKQDLTVYPRAVYVAVDCSDDFLRDVLKEGIIPLADHLAAHVCNVSGGVLVRFRNASCMTIQVIAHESTHAALYLFDYFGCKLNYDDQEPLAFLVDCIAGFCDKVKIESINN